MLIGLPITKGSPVVWEIHPPIRYTREMFDVV